MPRSSQKALVAEFVLAGLLVFSLLFAWKWTVEATRGVQLFYLFVAASLAGISYAGLVVVGGTRSWVRRTALVLGLGSALLMMPSALMMGVAAAAGAVLLAEIGVVRVERFKRDFLRAKTFPLAIRCLPLFLAGLGLVLSLVIIVSPLGLKTLTNPVPVPLLRGIFKAIDPAVSTYLGFPISTSIDSIIANMERTNNPQVIRQVRQRYERLLGIPLTGDEDIPTIVSKKAEDRITAFQSRVGENVFLLGVWGSLFLFVSIGIPPLSWIISGLVIVTIKMMVSLGVVVVHEETVVRKTLQWKHRLEV